MQKLLLSLIITTFLTLFHIDVALAQPVQCPSGSQVGDCYQGNRCEPTHPGSTILVNSGVTCINPSPRPTPTQGPGDCDGPEDINKCVNGKLCVKRCQPDEPCTYTPSGQDCGSGVGSAVIGPVYPPMTILNINTEAGDINTIGIIYFANRVVLLITIIAGILVMFNFIKAGWLYLLGGAETKAAAEVKDLLTYSIIGLVIIAVTYTIAGLIGLIFFGNAAFILQPTLYSALDIW